MPSTAYGFIFVAQWYYTCATKNNIVLSKEKLVLCFFFPFPFCFSLLSPPTDPANRGINNYRLHPEIWGCLLGAFEH